MASEDVGKRLETMLLMHNGMGMVRFCDDSEGQPESHISEVHNRHRERQCRIHR